MPENYTFYRVEKRESIAWVTLNRPEKKNAMGPAAWKEIVPIFADIQEDNDVRVVIISGEGADFCAGIDIMSMAPEIPAMQNWDMSAGAKQRLFRSIFPMQDTMTCIEKCTKPVICAIHGYCIGAGLDMASACDIRLACEDTRISLREAAVAFIADVGSLQRMPHIVGQGITRELTYTAKYIDAQRAREINLANGVFPDKESLLQGAQEMAMEIAGNSPLAVQGAKEVLNFSRGKSIADGLEYVAARSAMILPSDDMAETVQAMMEKRRPQFPGA